MDEVDLLVDLVSVPSPTGDTAAITQRLMDLAPSMGLRARTDEAGNVHMTTGEGRPRIIILCHMDTVPGNLPVHLEGETLHGRGSVDAKGCLAAAMLAASRMTDGAPGSVQVVAVPDEEGPSLGVRHLVTGPAPEAVVVGEPSGWQGMTIGYKGILRLRYINSTPKAHAGAEGRNSAECAVAFWAALQAYCEKASDASGETGMFRIPVPTLEAITTSDDGMALTTEMEVDVRQPPDGDNSALLEFLEERKGDATLQVVEMVPGVIAPKGNPLVRALLGSIRSEDGKPSFRLKTGTSDMNLAHAAWPHVPIVAYGPGDSRLDHTPEERQDLTEYRRAIDVLAATLERVGRDL
jgi:LysW-gamma-L-lysine carboxypeptidase